jgi:hypothetical protein
MFRRMAIVLAAGLMGAGISASVEPAVSAESPAHASVASKGSPHSVSILKAPHDVTQGDKYDVVVRVGSPRLAKTLQIQMRTTDYFGTQEWTQVKTVRIAGKAKHAVTLVATGVGKQRFRALAAYREGKPQSSPAFGMTVWQWTDLHAIPSYYETGGIYPEYGQFGMNGDQYRGWFTYVDYGMWESRYTPGRNCKAFRGVFGVTDDSSDGSSAEFTLLAEEGDVVYQSPSLVPGAVETVQFDVARPYRFAIQARDTSPEGAVSYPAIGNPEFLCNTAY